MKRISLQSVLLLTLWTGLVCSIAGATSHGAPPDTPEVDVIYVPTPQPVVDRMLQMAEVDAGDLLYDLGSGDGRIVITAAERYGTRGIGIDIDPQRIEESRWNAEEAGVTDKVRFVRGDLFEIDLTDASVVTLYLLPRLNMELRPKLFRELRPGTPVVSHEFAMGDWLPDRTVYVGKSEIHRWWIPADIQGRWNLTYGKGRDRHRFELQLAQHFQRFSGLGTVGEQQVVVEDGRLRGRELEFSVQAWTAGEYRMLVFSGRVRDESMEGRVVDSRDPEGFSRVWRGERSSDGPGLTAGDYP